MQINLTLVHKLISSICQAKDEIALKQIHLDLLSKDGLINNYFKSLKTYDKSESQVLLKELNILKQKAIALMAEQEASIANAKINEAIQKEYIDVTLPGRFENFGKLHPISVTIKEILNILSIFNFQIVSGNELEDDWHNFSALNIPKSHPARQMQDTFYIKDESDILLRTQTSNVQIRFMSQAKPPFKFLSYGKVYRNDSDSTHAPMFHQIEGVYIDKDVNFANMKFLLEYLLKKLFNGSIEIRFRPSFFPFTSPSCEIDIKLPGSPKWLEIIGCGMLHPNVLKNVGIDDAQWQGFAFGAGIERIAMIKYGIKDIRHLFEGNLAWLKRYGISPLNFT
jgi:phenylalanyl-tRNA synthetase alpha chain